MATEVKLAIDPKLPAGFYNTRNEERRAHELDTWWDKPFVVTLGDGTYRVHCLDGGAWDRPTTYGVASDLAAAHALAETKLRKWQAMRAQPVGRTMDDGRCAVVRMPQRPDEEMEVLYEATDLADAMHWMKERASYGRTDHTAAGE